MNPELLIELQTRIIRDEIIIALSTNSPKRLHKAFTWSYTEEGLAYWTTVWHGTTLSPDARAKLEAMLRASAPKPLRGFAAMTPERQRAIASAGGKAVKPESRSFSQNRDLAKVAGKKGGQAVPREKRTFSTNPELAVEAGRKGGKSARRRSP